MNTTNQLKTVLAISVIIAMIAMSNGLSAVNAQTGKYIITPNGKKISDQEYRIHITDVIPFYTYQGISKLTNDNSVEDVDVINFAIQNNDEFIAQYANDNNGNFVFVGIFDI